MTHMMKPRTVPSRVIKVTGSCKVLGLCPFTPQTNTANRVKVSISGKHVHMMEPRSESNPPAEWKGSIANLDDSSLRDGSANGFTPSSSTKGQDDAAVGCRRFNSGL